MNKDEKVAAIERHIRSTYVIPLLRTSTSVFLRSMVEDDKGGGKGVGDTKDVPYHPKETEIKEAIFEVDAYLESTLKHDKKRCQCDICIFLRSFVTSPIILDYLKTMLDFGEEQFQQAANSCLVFMLLGMLVMRDRS